MTVLRRNDSAPRRRPAIVVLCACALIASCESLTEVVAHDTYRATLSGRAVRPDSVSTSGGGGFQAILSSDTSAMTYELTYAQLSSAATGIHLHGPAADTVNASVIVDLSALPSGGTSTITLGTSGEASGSIDLARPVTLTISGDSLRRLLMLGLVYVDIHTGNHSGGEVRGQLAR
jgi:hypothetical protein